MEFSTTECSETPSATLKMWLGERCLRKTSAAMGSPIRRPTRHGGECRPCANYTKSQHMEDGILSARPPKVLFALHSVSCVRRLRCVQWSRQLKKFPLNSLKNQIFLVYIVSRRVAETQRLLFRGARYTRFTREC